MVVVVVVSWGGGGCCWIFGERKENPWKTSTRWERPRARERKGGQQACYRLLLLTADPGLSGDVDSLQGLE